MIYGEKFLQQFSMESLQTEINNTDRLITELYDFLYNDDISLNESLDDYNDEKFSNFTKFEKFMANIYDKILHFLAKIVDIVSNIFKKILPKFYQFLQGIVARIKNTQIKNAIDKEVDYKGEKTIEYYVLNSEFFTFYNELNKGDYLTEIDDYYEEFKKGLYNINGRNPDKEDVESFLNKLQPKATKLIDNIANQADEFNKHDENYYINEVKEKLVSYQDYSNAIFFLDQQVEKDKKMHSCVGDMLRDLTFLQKRYSMHSEIHFNRIKNVLEVAPKQLMMDSIIRPADVSAVCKIYYGVVAIIQKALNSEISVAKEIHKHYFQYIHFYDAKKVNIQ